MHVNWSLMLNIVLLSGVLFAIARVLIARNQSANPILNDNVFNSVETAPERVTSDDVIAVRKVQSEELPIISACREIPSEPSATPTHSEKTQQSEAAISKSSRPVNKSTSAIQLNSNSIVIFLLAKENRYLAGYELLQTILSVGLRFGEGQLFHRHQNPNGQGPVLCSLATATSSGTFDLQNIGGFSVHGLCLFMQASGAAGIDSERFQIMLDTAKQLSEGLNTHILDDQRKPWTTASESRYLTRINSSQVLETT